MRDGIELGINCFEALENRFAAVPNGSRSGLWLLRRPWGGVGNKATEKVGPELRSTGPDAMAAMAG